MSESEIIAHQRKQQQQFPQQPGTGPMANMAWQQYPPPDMHFYSPYAGPMYGQGFNQGQQPFYYHPGKMGPYGPGFNQQHMQQQQQQQPQQQIPQSPNNQGKQPNQQSQQQQQQQQIQQQQQTQQQSESQTPVANLLDDDSDLPPLPPGPPPPVQSNKQPPQNNQNQSQIYQHQPYFNPYGHNNWNGMYNDGSQFNGQIRFNLQNKKTGLGFSPSGNSGAAKKKRKRNKNLAAQNNSNFQGNNASSNFMSGPNLKSDVPPLPPPKQEPPATPIKDEKSSSTVINPITPGTNVQSSTDAKPSINASITGDWPENLKNYVNRCYEKCQTAVDKDQVEIILKGKITRAANDGSLWVKDWDNEILPSIHSERMTMTIKPRNSPLKHGFALVNSQGGLRKPGLSTSLGARLGARLSAGHKRSKSKSGSRSCSRSRSRSRSQSRTPPRKYRRSTSSSSNQSDREHNDYKTTTTTTLSSSTSSASASKSKKSTRNKQNHNKKSKKNKQVKSHFYSEFGLATGNDELGSKEKLQQRAARFNDSCKSANISIREDVNGDFDFTGLHIIGTCQDLEKPYLRLTSAPAASSVRPVSVLKNSLAHVKKRWLEGQDYRYACDQLKSIRQDLTVQGIRDSFTVHVYETHARVALERGDHEEFNQCQTQLRMLYQDLEGKNRCEFIAYRILYYIFTKNSQDLTTILASLTAEDKKDKCILYALQVRSAWSLGNFHSFFKLYREAPRMAAFLMDWFIARERKLALKTMIKAYRQNLAVDFIVAELAFDTLDKFYEFVSEFGLIYADPQKKQIDCKTSSGTLGSW
ncbi:leukocyte receptor cluster member 8 homolog [Leptopilina heterotoma]|uniref:leukocyte receptor cluster member 8 homolog n=1 Tax=Leptopilina heterotoma TaxID=63436 RepID=UPI001CA8CA70|nr:leukocyte receptor cluster member 8 homolog [Leptopilina heterotoma]